MYCPGTSYCDRLSQLIYWSTVHSDISFATDDDDDETYEYDSNDKFIQIQIRASSVVCTLHFIHVFSVVCTTVQFTVDTKFILYTMYTTGVQHYIKLLMII